MILENGEVRLTRKAVFTVAFDSNGGSPMDSQTVLDGGKAADPGAPMNNGNIFDGWHLTGSDGSTAEERYSFDTPVQADITLKAKWIPIWVVIFDSDNGENAKMFPVHDGNTVDRPEEDPEREGSRFAGWYAVGEDGNLETDPFSFDTLIRADTFIRAKWLCTVTFKSDSESEFSSQTVAKGEKATEPVEKPKKDGYVFLGWGIVDPDTSLMTLYDFGLPVTEDITLTALWKKVELFTVTFDCNYDGGIVFIQLVSTGGYATEPDDPSRLGYEFLGWYLSTDDANPYDFNTAVTGDITLVARWEEIQTYIVAFDSDGGSPVPDQTVPAGGNAVEPDAPIKSGNLFGEWHLVTGDSMAADAFDFNEAVNGDITLKARWIPIHTIVFDSNGGSEVGPQAVPEGSKIVQPKVPVKSGNLFAGWHLVTEDGIAAEDFDFNNAVDSDITLKARWIPISVAKILNLPSGLVSVKSGAFIDVESVQAIRLPGNLTSFNKDAFDEGMTILAPANSPSAQKAKDLGMLVVEE